MTRMLNGKASPKIPTLILSLVMMVMLGLFSSCMPSATAPAVKASNSTNNNDNKSEYGEPNFAINGIFVQEGGTQTTNQFALPINFTDSYLVRGKELSQYLRTLPNTTRFCMVGKYTYDSLSDKFLVMAAKPKSYTDLVKKTTEFYLLVEPANDQANQNDCLTYNLTSSLFSSVIPPKIPSASFSLTQLCSNCNSGVTSQGFRLYFNNGEEVPALNLSALSLTISGSTTSTTNTCVESTVCQANGYDCCMEGACAKDGSVRPGAITQPGFSEAQLDVASNPNRFIVYPQFYFVCPNRPETDGSEDLNEPTDPSYEAHVRLMELNNLHQCLNKVDGEFSYCTVKFTSASQKITLGNTLNSNDNNFSSADKGYLEDINFKELNSFLGTGDYRNNIVKIYYAGQTLYEANKTPLLPADGHFVNVGNDDITTAQIVKIKKPLPVNALDDNLYLTFKIDGSCERLGTNLARCSKTYIHGSSISDAYKTTYHNASTIYSLPSYADTSSSANIIVKVSGIVVPEDILNTWTKYEMPNRIEFIPNYLYQNQTVEITYYITDPVKVASLIKARTAAQGLVNTMCICASTEKCNLKPLYNTANAIVNYECTHPTATTNEPPANQTVYVSNKNVPHKYYDINGLYYEDYSNALAQEGTEFSYKNNDILKPTNLAAFTGYTGFNEIYGSFYKMIPASARPAKVVNVKKDKIYDLFANSGVFSTCLTCGSDYYSSLQKIFPQSLTGIGGGYSPDNFESRRVNNSGTYRSDDLLYGRACFIPATMIPWTHMPAGDVKDQRRNRLAAQHFLFANGYNRDWYGFDYGSLIGSFDGVTWFSIGNQRRIKATSNKLFIAVNAYYGDLNTDSNFNVTVSETTPYSPPMPAHDTESAGAECQKSHFCSQDNDCFRQLGYDYTCQNVSSITTSWPQSDANGNEVIGAMLNKSLVSLVGGANGQSKRCVYRGRGAPCHQNLNSLGATFNKSTVYGTLTCSNNNMCQSLSTGNSNRFNDRLARFANTPIAQNTANAAPTSTDTVGLAARIIGRPFDYYGTSSAPSPALPGLNANGLAAICIPGKNIAASTTAMDLHLASPALRVESSDKILGIGITMTGSQNSKYLNACPATNSVGASIQHTPTLALGGTDINTPTITQNLSTNLLNLAPIVANGVFSSTNGSQVTSVGYQRNSCLRAPGASCFSDMDCAPSEFIANKVKTADLTGILNAAEKKYWEEDLVCGNPDYKYLAPGVLNTATFNIKNNVCCREFGKTFTVATETNTSDHHWCEASTVKVAGVNTSINSLNRYSRVHTAYDKMTCNLANVNSTTSFALTLKEPGNNNNIRYNQIKTQFKTLDTINQRTCCTKNWVRHWATTNGGGHTWGSGKLQTIEKLNFRALNWLPTTTDFSGMNAVPFECNSGSYLNPSCEIRNFSAGDTDLYLKYFGGLELVGIPQVALMSEDHVQNTNNDYDPINNPTPTGGPNVLNAPPNQTVHKVGATGSLGATVAPDFLDDDNKRRFSATNYNALDTNLKKIFSEDEFSCCLPTGQQVPNGTTAQQCCTGYLGNTGSSNLLRCCLPDYTDLTLYLNRYVSSEGRGLPDSAYDPNTGYIKDPAAVELLANQKGLCCSGTAVRGVAIRTLPIPIDGNVWINQSDAWTKRFVYLSNAVDNNATFGPIGSIFDAGVRWNDHVYCVPTNLPAQIPPEP